MLRRQLRMTKSVIEAIFLASISLCIGCSQSSPPKAPQVATTSTTEDVKPEETADTLPGSRLPSELPREKTNRSLEKGDWFEDVAQSAGVMHTYRAGFEAGLYTLLETVGGGVAMIDYDRDGDVDLFFSGGGTIEAGPPIKTKGLPSKLFRNDGNWAFTDVSDEVSLPLPAFYCHGCSTADYDRDGWPDLFIAGYGGVQLLKNEDGKRFVDVTQESGLAEIQSWSVQGAWVDINRDGHLDLYLMTYAEWKPAADRICDNQQGQRDVCGPTLFPGMSDMLFLNQADGTFKDVTVEAGLVPENRGLGVISADFNEDSYPDIFVGNDVQFNQLYLGQEELPFQEEGLLSGTAVSPTGEREGTMGVSIGDFNRDGMPDLWYTNFANQDNSLCQAIGGASFQNVSVKCGLGGVSRPWVGFGTVMADFDHDGWLDIFVSNGHVGYERLESPYFQPPQLFQNVKGDRFQEISNEVGPYFHNRYSGRGVAVGDLNDDGALDLVVVHQDDPVAILKNRLPCPHWIRFRLVGTDSNTEGIGAKVTILNSDSPLSTWVTGADSYASSSDRRVLFSLSDASPVDVSVTWPSGKSEKFTQLQPQEMHELVEGKGSPL